MNDTPANSLTTILRTIQILCGALALGMFILGTIMTVLVANRGPAMNPLIPARILDWPMISTFALGIFCLMLPIALWLPAVISRTFLNNLARDFTLPRFEQPNWDAENMEWLNQLPPLAAQRLLAAYTSQRLVSTALLEAAGMLAAVAIFLEGHWLGYAIWVLSLLLILLMLPTQSRLIAWLNAQRERLMTRPIEA